MEWRLEGDWSFWIERWSCALHAQDDSSGLEGFVVVNDRWWSLWSWSFSYGMGMRELSSEKSIFLRRNNCPITVLAKSCGFAQCQETGLA